MRNIAGAYIAGVLACRIQELSRNRYCCARYYCGSDTVPGCLVWPMLHYVGLFSGDFPLRRPTGININICGGLNMERTHRPCHKRMRTHVPLVAAGSPSHTPISILATDGTYCSWDPAFVRIHIYHCVRSHPYLPRSWLHFHIRSEDPRCLAGCLSTPRQHQVLPTSRTRYRSVSVTMT